MGTAALSASDSRTWNGQSASRQSATYVRLVALSRDGNARAFEQLVKRNQSYVLNSIKKLAPRWENQADLCQEVFIRIWKSINQLKTPEAFNGWVRQIISHTFYDELRRKRRRVDEVPLSVPGVDDPDAADSLQLGCQAEDAPDERLDRKELMDKVYEAMALLPREFRDTIYLREVEGLSYSQIARIMHTEVGTVKSRLARARMRVKEQIESYFESAD